jgi:hypothetical protein
VIGRRRLPRHSAGWPGCYVFNDPTVEVGTCRVIDISRMGAGIEVFGDTPLDPIGQYLSVDVACPTGGSVGIHLEGEVRNVALGETGGVRVGLEFIGISEADQAILTSLERMQVAW